MSEEELVVTKEEINFESIFNDILTGVVWVLALPVQGIAWSIRTIRRRRYNPEKVICPGCGYRGEKGSDYRTCIVEFTPVISPEKAMIRHICLRCRAPYFTQLYRPAKDWVATGIQTEVERVRAAAAKGEL